MVKALIAALLVVALAAIGLVLVKREELPAVPRVSGQLAALWPDEADGYAVASGPLSFPADHGAHPDHRTEVWHFSGTLAAAQGGAYGFQLTFVRVGVIPPAVAIGPSAWATRDLYWAQFSLTDIGGNRFHAAERFERAAMGLSGWDRSRARVWVGDWAMEAQVAGPDEATFRLRAGHDGRRIALTLRSLKPPIDPAAAAGVRNGSGAPVAFQTYLMTRLAASGTVHVEALEHKVEGEAWLDRAWGIVPVPVGAVVWDRFQLRLSDGRELAAVRLRRQDGSGEPVATGMLVGQDGAARVIAERALSIEVLEHWSSPHDGMLFPTRWRIRLPEEALDLEVKPYVAAQERRAALRAWAGAVRVAGMAHGLAIQGNGHVDTIGYGEAQRHR